MSELDEIAKEMRRLDISLFNTIVKTVIEVHPDDYKRIGTMAANKAVESSGGAVTPFSAVEIRQVDDVRKGMMRVSDWYYKEKAPTVREVEFK